MNKPNKYLIAIAISFVVAGIIEPFFSIASQQGISLGHTGIIGILLFGWCKSHVKLHSIKEPAGSALMCGFLGIIGVTLYLFRAFGAQKGFIKTLLGILYLLLCLALYLLVTFITQDIIRM